MRELTEKVEVDQPDIAGTCEPEVDQLLHIRLSRVTK